MSASVPVEEKRPSSLLPWLMLGTLFAVPLLVTARPVAVPLLDPDIWWHLRVGQWVVEHGTVPTLDPFTLEGRPWVAYSWLYEVAVYGLHAAFGLTGIVLFRMALSLAVVAAVFALVHRLEARFLIAIGLCGLATLALAMLFSERPWLFTVLFSTLTLHAVVALRDTERPLPRWIWTLPLIFTLWANCHIQFVYGLLLLALACLAPLLQQWYDARFAVEATPGMTVGSTRWRQLLLLSGLCLLATLLNPYHARIYAVVVEYATQPGPFRWVNELKALEFREPSDWVMLAFVCIAWFTLGRRQRVDWFEVLLLSGTVLLAFRARRDLWLAVLAALVILTARAPRDVPSSVRFRPSFAGVLGLLAVLIGLAVFLFRARDLTEANLQAKVAERFPVRAADFVRLRGYRGPLFNDFNWGGYLILALPHLPVAIDGRTNLHGDARSERYGEVWSGLPGWHDDPDLTAAALVIAPKETALASLLQFDERFLLVYEDELAQVYIRQDRQR